MTLILSFLCAALIASSIAVALIVKIDLSSACENDLDRWIIFAAGLKNRELRTAVDFNISIWVLHRIYVARLACEVEEAILVLNHITQAMRITHIRDIDQ